MCCSPTDAWCRPHCEQIRLILTLVPSRRECNNNSRWMFQPKVARFYQRCAASVSDTPLEANRISIYSNAAIYRCAHELILTNQAVTPRASLPLNDREVPVFTPSTQTTSVRLVSQLFYRFQTSTEARLLRSAQSVCGTLGSAPLTGPTTISTAGKTRYSPGKISAFPRLYLDVCGLLLFHQQRGNVVLVSVRVQRFFELSSAIDCRMAKTPKGKSALLNLPSNARPLSVPVLRVHRCFFFSSIARPQNTHHTLKVSCSGSFCVSR